MRKILFSIIAIVIVSCTYTTKSVDEKVSFEFSTGINLPEFYIQLEKINEWIRGHEISKDTAFKGIPYDEKNPLVDQINKFPKIPYTSIEEFQKDYPFYKYFYPNTTRKGELINSPIIGFAYVSDTLIVNNYIHKFADSTDLSRPYLLEWNHTCHSDTLLCLIIFEFENNTNEILNDKLIKSINYRFSGLFSTSKFRRFLARLNNQDTYEVIIEFEPSLLKELSFEKSTPILFTFKFNKIEYSKSFTLNEMIDNNYQASICDEIPRDELILLKSNYDLIKIKL